MERSEFGRKYYSVSDMIKYFFDKSKLVSVVQSIIKLLIIKRAYMGYCEWMEASTDDELPLPFNEFKQFEFWKIALSFRIYLHRFHGIKFSKTKVTFKSIFFNIL